MRFLASHESVFNRVDDSSGRLQDVYRQAAARTPDLLRQMTPEALADVPALLTAALSKDTHGFVAESAIEAVDILPPDALLEWDKALARGAASDGEMISIRQSIAGALGDIDAYVALETLRPEWARDPLRIAEALLQAERFDAALNWVRRESAHTGASIPADDVLRRTPKFAPRTELRRAGGAYPGSQERPRGRAVAALVERSRRRSTFRRCGDYVRALDDFQEFDELDPRLRRRRVIALAL